MEANESHKSEDAFLNEVQRRFQAAASKPEGSGVIMDICVGSCFVGCFCKRTSRTVSGIVVELLDATRESKFSGPPPSLSATSQSAALTLPSIISLANVRAFCSVDLA